jgi:dTDP-glucose 4,6-dehydratase
MSDRQKVLVTGSLGFIFSNFLRKAIYEKHPYTFTSIDRVSRKNHLNSVYANKNHQFYIVDVCDDHIMDNVFSIENPDIVIHGAAETFVDTSIENPNIFVKNNILGTQNVINACVKHKVGRLIYISTDEVYGQLADGEAPWSEDNPLGPRNPYSASKASGELLVRAASATFDLPFNIVRPSNNYGPRQTPEKFIPKIVKCIMDKTPIPVYGQGLQLRDWTHVFDNCAAILTIMKSAPPNETYNVSACQEFSNIEVVHEVCKVMGAGHDLISFVKDRPGHDFRYAVDTTKIKNLGWTPGIKFRNGIANTIEWYQNNKFYLNL